MLDGYRVVAAVPAGRRRYLDILLPYLRAQRGILDRCDLWRNTTDPKDVSYLRRTADADPFFRLVEPAIPVDGVRSVFHFFRACVEPDTVYVRFDDDVCWVAPDAVEQLVRFRLAHSEYALVLANTVNNSLCSHIHQRLGCIPLTQGFCAYDCLGDVGWRSPLFARLAHESFLRKLAAGELPDYAFARWVAWQYERISINCLCWRGRDFALFGGEVAPEDEEWLTQHYPARIGRPAAVCGTALVSHFAYGPQRPWLEGNSDVLDRYRALAAASPGGGQGERRETAS